jgi:hypothetical protein
MIGMSKTSLWGSGESQAFVKILAASMGADQLDLNAGKENLLQTEVFSALIKSVTSKKSSACIPSIFGLSAKLTLTITTGEPDNPAFPRRQ